MNIIKIEKAVYGGYGLGFNDGKVILVKNGIPGDKIKYTTIEDKKNHTIAGIETILEKSDMRIDSPCSNFPECGGCSYLNISYKDELNLKKDILIDSLKRIGKIKNIPEIDIISSKRFNYRSHGKIKSFQGRPGFFKEKSNIHIPFNDDGCLLLHEKLNNFIKNHQPKETEFRVAIDSMEKIFFSGNKKNILDEKSNETLYKRDLNLFFQANLFLRPKMIDLITKYSLLTKKDKFIDMGCGTGFFSIPLAKTSHSGIGFDIKKESIYWAKKNALSNNIKNIKFLKSSIKGFNISDEKFKSIIIDPPRSGISKEGRKKIISLKPEVIVYVSCNPATYSRDISQFISEGYLLKELTLIDMFPATRHIEVISQLHFDSAQ